MSKKETDENGCFKLFLGITLIFVIAFVAITGMDGVAVLGQSIWKTITGALLMLAILYIITKAIN